METLNPTKLANKIHHAHSTAYQVDSQTHCLQVMIFHCLFPKALGHLIMQGVVNLFFKVPIVFKSPNTVENYEFLVKLMSSLNCELLRGKKKINHILLSHNDKAFGYIPGIGAK